MSTKQSIVIVWILAFTAPLIEMLKETPNDRPTI
jgi:hypothetical protein